MDIKILPSALKGTVAHLQSKSYSHRILIASALAGNTDFKSIDLSSDDVLATAQAVLELSNEIPRINANQSGTTLRIILPVLAALKNKSYLTFDEQLAHRPIEPLISAIRENGCTVKRDTLQICIEGKLQGGDFYLPGNISSQFISGLLYALPLCEQDSRLHVTTSIESRPYIDMTLKVLGDFGVLISENVVENPHSSTVFNIKGSQKFLLPQDINIETDWSNSAFWLASSYMGSHVEVRGLNTNSLQGDKAVVEILEKFKTRDTLIIDLGDIPDLLPVLAIAAAYRDDGAVTEFTNLSRLHMKESDRVFSTEQMILNLGGDIFASDEKIVITSHGALKGGTVNAWDDHRIAMAAAIAATSTETPVTILGAQAVNKSYPKFFDQFQKLGGKIVKL